MYLSNENHNRLDVVVKDFEVAYRSYIVDKIFLRYPNYTLFKGSIVNLKKIARETSVANSKKNRKMIEYIDLDARNKFDLIERCYRSFVSKDSCAGNVLYVSDLNNFITIFFHELFTECTRKFLSIDEFMLFSSKYHKTRNALSHPASAKVLLNDCKEILTFVRRLTNTIDDKYFWYKKKEEINRSIEVVTKAIEGTLHLTHNLFDINVSHKNLVCRDSELEQLYENLIGSEKILRTSGLALVYGYGGVGKTALVLEFAYNLIKKSADQQLSPGYEFIYFFSSKDEALKLFETTGKLYIDKIRKQVGSFAELKNQLISYLKVESLPELHDKSGLIIIDNIENLSPDDRDEIFTFIKMTPRSIKYILTSRNEESSCEFKLHLKEFSDEVRGVDFITKYIEENDLNIDISEGDMRRLLYSSKGNTLILVLSLEGLSDNKHSLAEITDQLERVESQNIEVIADFMYKNTFDETIKGLQLKGFDPISIIKTISIYGDPLDLYSISALSNVSRREAEEVCDTLSRKLIINKSNGLYSLNEFANKFIFIKYLPDKIETEKLRSKIYRYKQNVDSRLTRLNSLMETSSVLKQIMEDWKPTTYTDVIAISQAFGLFSDKYRLNRGNKQSQETMIKEINNILEMTSHPYVLVQKVRMLERFLSKFNYKRTNEERRMMINEISNGYEHAIELIDFHYTFISNTKSYAVLKKNFGIFIFHNLNSPSVALRYLEESKQLLSNFPKDKVFFTVLMYLSDIYLLMYREKGDMSYRHLLTSTYKEAERLGKAGVVDNALQDKFIDKFKRHLV